MTNPFATETAWDVSTDTMLPAGNHVVKILEVDGDGTSSGGHPQIALRVGNDKGAIRDWIVVTPSTIGKVVQLTDAAGLERPTDEQVDGLRVSQEYLDQLINRQVGVVVREEPDQRNPGQTRLRVKGYVDKAHVGSDLTGPEVALSFESTPSATKKADEPDIPF